MTFPILGGNSAVGGYSIDNSLRFNDNDSSNLNITPSGAGNRDTFTTSFWIKRGNLGSGQRIWSAGTSIGTNNNNVSSLLFESNDTLKFFGEVGGSASFTLQTNQLFRDVSAWYHIVLAVDTTQSTSSNRVKIYVNGSQITSFSTETYMSQNTDTFYNATNLHTISYSGGGGFVDGYIAEFVHIDGQQLSPTDFGEFDEDSGIWKPIQYTGTFGSAGYYLDFENSGSLGTDQSGNGNNFTPTNLASTDQTTDTPTNNFCTLNPLTPVVTHTLSEANLKSTNSSGTHGGATATINYPTSGKWYHEVRINAEDSSKGQGVAIGNQVYRSATDWGNYTNLVGYMSDGDKYIDTGYASYGTAHNAGNIIGVAYNADDQELTFYHNNSSQGTITTSEMDGKLDFDNISPIVFGRNMGQTFNLGQDSSFAGAETRQNNSDGNGYGDFYYSPPSGYLALCTQNLATALSPTIDDGSQYFHTQLYTGDGQDNRTVTNDAYSGDFQPDFLWIKERSSTSAHRIFDSTRGASKRLEPNANLAEATDTSNHKSFDTDGFTLGTSGSTNANGDTYVAWQWKANGGTTSTNTDGSQNTTVQVNSTAGFSIVKRTGTGSAGATYGHGLGVVPEVIINKGLNTNEWYSYFKAIGGGSHWISLESSGASVSDANMWNNTDATSSVFTVGNSGGSNGSGVEYINYCFHSVEGYSKFGSYEGNAVADGTFVYTGFRPAWIMIKRYSGAGHDWIIIDTKRFTFNVIEDYLKANSSDAEIDTFSIDEDILSNGFKLRGTSTNINGGGSSYIYMAFAENPFVTSSGVPVTAR